MTTQSAFFHALLRPAILQILRSTGYHSAKPSVVDSLTDIAGRYLAVLCEKTASHAIHNKGDAGDYTIVDVRLALQEVGALLPEKTATEQSWLGEEDTTGVDEFIEWFSGQRMTELMEMGIGDGEIDATDYLNGEFFFFLFSFWTHHSGCIGTERHQDTNVLLQPSRRSTPKQRKIVNSREPLLAGPWIRLPRSKSRADR